MTPTAKLLAACALIIAAIWAVQKFTPAGPSGGPRPAADLPAGADTAVKDVRYQRGKELVAPTGFINSEPFTIAELSRDHVVLVDFWTYSCINCQRTQPYLNEWYRTYRDAGLIIVGVHTPEFEFEKDIANVQSAVSKAGIRYPVVLDSEYGTWRAYGNQYWPRKYLIDADGFIVYDHIGEGGYEETERQIQRALAELAQRRGTGAPMPQISAFSETPHKRPRTPEIYFGALRNAPYFGNVKTAAQGTQTLVMPAPNRRDDDVVYLSGVWDFSAESARCIRDCVVRLRYEASVVNVVAGSNSPKFLTVSVDDGGARDVSVMDATLYEAVRHERSAEHELELRVPDDVELYTFTFG